MILLIFAILFISLVNVIAIFAAYTLGRYNQPEQAIRQTLKHIATFAAPKVSFISPTKLRKMLEVEKELTHE